MPLPPLLPVSEIKERLEIVFPAGTPNRNYVVRGMAAKTVFVMLYVGAVEGAERWVRPNQVTRMTDAQASHDAEADRDEWLAASMRSEREAIDGRWFAGDTREPIRDETLRAGLVRTGAVVERKGLPTTSPLPRYALAKGFAALFGPVLTGDALVSKIGAWQKTNLTGAALARVTILRRGSAGRGGKTLVTFPDGESRHMDPGPSSVITKAVVEEFATRFLEKPAVIWLSESRRHVVARDDTLAQAIGLRIQPDKNLPDLILVDLGVDPESEPVLVFVEVVATAGAISDARREALMALASEAFSEEQVAFVTAYADRDEPAFKASDAEPIRQHSRSLGHVPLIDTNPRRDKALAEQLRTEARRLQHIGFQLPEQVRYNERTAGERVNGRLKDEFGGRHVRVRGASKVMCHCMFGVLALTADQLVRLVT